MAGIVDQLDMNKIGLKKQFEEEVERYNKFQRTVLKMQGKTEILEKDQEFDIRTYAKYVLQEGSINEKRDLLMSLKSKIILEKGNLRLSTTTV